MQKGDANSTATHLIVLYFDPLQKFVRCHMVMQFDNKIHPDVLTFVFKDNLWLMRDYPIKLTAASEFKASIRRCSSLAKMLFWVLAVLVLFNTSLSAQPETKPKNIWVLATYSPGSPVAYLWDRGIRSVFEAEEYDRSNQNPYRTP